MRKPTLKHSTAITTLCNFYVPLLNYFITSHSSSSKGYVGCLPSICYEQVSTIKETISGYGEVTKVIIILVVKRVEETCMCLQRRTIQ